MIKNHPGFLVLLLFFFTSYLFSQQTNLWSRISESSIPNSELHHTVKLKKFDSFELQVTSLRNELKYAPKRGDFGGRSATKIDFPDENGKMVTYLIKESEVMHPQLAEKFPQNKSYVGYAQNDASKRIHFSLNKLGLHAIIMDTKRGISYIEPLSKDKKKYRVYYRKDIVEERKFECFTENIQAALKSELSLKTTDDGKLRTYRLALAGTGEYSQFHISEQDAEGASAAEKKAIVMAAMTTALTRVNAIFENDLAISMQLVVNNEDIIYLDPASDPYSNFDGDSMISENQTNCDAVIGPANYDIGHVFSTGGGGLATRASVCQSGAKARGVTGSPFPNGDDFYFDFVAHEMGHQFGANHSFNGDDGNCGGGNRNDATAVEPGSGSSLMAYAGLCSSQNVQGKSDLYFHIISIEEIRNYLLNGPGGTCAVVSDLTLNLNAPTVDAGADFRIPKGTAFKLVGSGSDADGDPITFGWEQVDNEIIAVPPSETAVSGAVYRSYNPSESPVRYMPHLNTLITGTVSSTWEVTPSVARDLNFMLTVRDNNTEAGQVVSDDLKVTVVDAAGPFVVTSQNTEELELTVGTQETISWDVAGTTGNSINVSEVNILLSTDGGLTFPTILATGVPNDGSQTVTVPDIKSPRCFIIVEAVGNFFFAMNAKSFSIGSFNEVCNSYAADDTPLAIPDDNPNGVSSIITISDNVNVEKLKVSLINPPVNSGGLATPGITHTYLGDLSITLESPQGSVIELISNACDASEDIEAVLSDDGDPLSCNVFSPGISGSKKPVQELSQFNGENAQGNWILKVVDGAADDIGFLEAWSLEICSSEPVLGVNNYVFDDFTVFPNPSDGRFNVKFRSEETSDVEILVYDLLGRKIVKKNYQNQSNNFDERIDLQDVAGGIYILSVKRGNRMSSHKIRIK
jgi:subtilisin-like proprotein convertase family protein